MSGYIFPGIHVTIKEYACPCCGRLPPDIYDSDRNFYHENFLFFEGIRTEYGRPIPISKRGGGWRCPRFQFQMIMDRKTEATVSGHSFWALDLDVNSKKEVLEIVDIIKLKYPELRRIYSKYLAKDPPQTFVHIDRMYLTKPKISESWIKGFEL